MLKRIKKKILTTGRKACALFLAVCIVLTGGYFSDLGGIFRGLMTARAEGEYYGDLPENESEVIVTDLYNFIQVKEIASALASTDAVFYGNGDNGVLSQYGRLSKTSITVKNTATYYVNEYHITGQNQQSMPTNLYRAELYDFSGHSLNIRPAKDSNAVIRKFADLPAMIANYGSNVDYSDFAGCYVSLGRDSKQVVVVRNKIGGTGLGYVDPYVAQEDQIPNGILDQDSFHMDYLIRLMRLPEVQPLYCYLQVKINNSTTYYRIKKTEKIYAAMVEDISADNSGVFDENRYPYLIVDDDISGNFIEESGERISINGPKVDGVNTTYEYRDTDYYPANPANFQPYFTIEDNGITRSNRMSGSYSNSNLWLGSSAYNNYLPNGTAEMRWPTENNTTAYHHDYVAVFHNKYSKYNITFKNYDGTLLYTQENVQVNEPAVYSGDVPTKPASGNTEYVFVGWEDQHGNQYAADSLPKVSHETVYTAVFDEMTPKLMVEKTASKTSELELGETVTFTVKVTNAGNVKVTDIELTDTLVDLNVDAFTLEPDDSKEDITYTYTVTEQDLIAGKISNNVIATGKDPLSRDVTGEHTVEITTVPANSELTVTKTADPYEGLEVDDVITYTVEVKNSGNVTVSDITLSDTLVTISEDEFALAPNESKTITYTYTVTQKDVDAGSVDNTVTAKGKDQQGEDVTATDEASATMVEATAALSIVKTADPTSGVAVGDTITYTVVVTNTGNVSVKDGTLEDDHADLSGETFALAPGEEATFTYTYEVTQADVDAGVIVNTVKANATAERGENPAEVSATSTVTAEDAEAKLSITKTADPTSGVAVGDTITYTVVVTNTGNVSVKDGTLEDDHADLSGETFALAPGETTTFTYTYTVTQADVDAGEIVNVVKANATAERGDDPEEVEASATVTAEEAAAALRITKTAEPTSEVAVGDTITYTVVVTNIGNVSVKEGKLEDDHADLSDKSFELAPGESAYFTYTYTVLQKDVDAGKITNTVTANATAVRGNDPAEVSTDATVTTVEARPSLSVEKTASLADIVNVGDKINYTVIVTNTGNVTLHDVKAADSRVNISEKSYSLAPGESVTITYTYTVTQANVDNGTIINTVNARGYDPKETEVNASKSIETALTAESSLEVSLTASQTSGVAAGDEITFTVVVKNTGNVSVKDGKLEDALGGFKDKTFALEAGEDKTFTYNYTVTQADIDSGAIINEIKANATAVRGDDPEEVTAEVTVTTEDALAKLSVSKSADKTEGVKSGDTITYDVAVTNIGNVTVINGALEDDHADLSNKTFVLAPGETAKLTYTYTVTQADVDAGEIVNVVKANATALRGGDPTEVTATATVTTEAAAAELSITKSVDESANAVKAGDKINYTVVVKNTGNVTVKNVTLSDSLVTLKETFDLEPGKSETITYEYTVTEADVDAGKIVNVVKANGTAVRGDNPDEISATVTVIPGREALVIESETESWKYDGETHKNETYKVTYDGEEVKPDDETGKVFTLKTGDKLTITADAAGVKDYDTSYLANNKFTYTIDNAELYENVVTTFGTLSIDKRTVTLTSESGEKVYDGKALTKPDVTIGGDGFVDGEVSDLKAVGTVSKVSEGAVANTISYTGSDSYKATNYTITKTEGTLKITPKTLTIKWSDTSFAYDGKSHMPKAEIIGLVDGDTCEVTVEGAATESGNFTAKITAISNENYTISSEAASVKFEIYACTVTFVDGNGRVLQKEVVPFGTVPTYKGETPTKNSTAQSVYTFDGTWTPEITAVSQKETTYMARFTETKKEYYLAYKGYGGAEGTLPDSEIPESKKGSGTTILFAFKSTVLDEETYDHLQQILINGKAAPSDGWNKHRGSVIIELLPEYLDSLEPGEYKLTAVFDDGAVSVVDAMFRVLKSKDEPTPDEPTPEPTPVKPEPTPKTGDTLNMTYMAALLGVALAAMLMAILKRREEAEE